MFSTEQRRVAIEAFIKYDHSYADTIAELGYGPSPSTGCRCGHEDTFRAGVVAPPRSRMLAFVYFMPAPSPSDRKPGRKMAGA